MFVNKTLAFGEALGKLTRYVATAGGAVILNYYRTRGFSQQRRVYHSHTHRKVVYKARVHLCNVKRVLFVLGTNRLGRYEKFSQYYYVDKSSDRCRGTTQKRLRVLRIKCLPWALCACSKRVRANVPVF